MRRFGYCRSVAEAGTAEHNFLIDAVAEPSLLILRCPAKPGLEGHACVDAALQRRAAFPSRVLRDAAFGCSSG
jgi:hypothetical protein